MKTYIDSLSDPARRESEVETSMMSLREELNELSSITQHLIDRLKPVIRPAPGHAATTASPKEVQPAMAPMTKSIDECRGIVRIIRQNIGETIEELAI